MANRKNTFLIKRSSTPGKVPTAGDLLLGELALNTADVILYASGTTSNSILPIGWDRVARTGDTMTGTLYVPTISATTITGLTTNVNELRFNVDYTGGTAGEGIMFWDEDNGTVSLGMHGGVVSQQIGLEQYYYIKNQSGATIENGRVVRAAGTVGASGRILGEYMIADGSIEAKYALGIATEDIVNGDDGYVTEFGLVRGINTTGSLYGETWVGGDILYVSPTIAGGLTKVRPIAPNLHIEMAIVVYANANGSLFVRPNRYPSLGDLQSVYLNGTTNGDLLTLSGNTWTATKTLNGSYTITGDTTVGGQIKATTVSATTYLNLPTATTTTLGRVKISQAALDSSNPIVVSTTDNGYLSSITNITYSANTLTSTNVSGVTNNVSIGLKTKTGTILGSSFTGNPKTYDVIFTTPYPNVNYTISITGGVNRTFTYENKTITGFKINANANFAFTENVDWQTITIGES